MMALPKKRQLFGALILIGLLSAAVEIWFLHSSPSIPTQGDNRWALPFSSPSPSSLHCPDKRLSSLPAHTKLIEVVTEEPWFQFYRQQFGSFQGCPVHNCHLTRCRGHRTPDALTFMAETPTSRVFQPKPPGQTWVFITMESPVTVHEMNNRLDADLYSKFDLAMTYRDDSDIYLPYFTMEKLENPQQRIFTSTLKEKRGLAAQVASHCECQSHRAEYVRKMQEYIPVDVYGRCGNRSCGEDCFQMVGKEYKFFLAFENSLCAGYISDHFSEMYELDIVPIARGNVNYSKLLPPKTFIDTQSFPTVKALADYLQYLDRNDTAYTEYLEAKTHYKHKYGFIQDKQGLCDLCHHMHTTVPTKRRSDLHTWWSMNTSCVEPTDIL